MAYNITTTAGTTLATIADGTVNKSATSLTLIGKNYAGYGNFLNDNYIKLLENFAYITSPSNPLSGQLWYDSGNSVLKVYNGISGWKTIASSVSQSAAPGAPQIGDMWWDTTNLQLKVWGGVTWVTVGPTYTSVAGTSGAIVETIYDSGSVQHVVVKFYISNQVVSILSSSQPFIPQTAIPGFAIINPGLNIINKTALAGSQVTGDVSNALTLQGVNASQFIRSDQNSGTSYQLTAGGGLVVGSDLNIVTTSGTEVKLYNQTINKDLNFYVSPGGTATNAVQIQGSTASVTFSNAVSVGTTLNINGATTLNSTLYVSGQTKFASGVVPNLTNTINIGASGNIFASVYAQNFIGSLTGNVTATQIAGNVTTVYQPYITGVGTLANLNVTGNVTTSAIGIVNAGGGVIGTLLTPVQNNITYVGQLGNLVVTGPVSFGSTLDHNAFLTGNVNGLAGGLYQASQYYRLSSNIAGTNVNTPQSILGLTNGVNLVGSTIYEFEGLFALDKTAGTTPHQLGISFNGGTATFNHIAYEAITTRDSSYLNSTSVFNSYVQTVTNTAMFDSINTAQANVSILVKGTVSINTGGYFLPQYTASAAPGGAYTTRQGSYFKISPIGLVADGTVSKGNWS